MESQVIYVVRGDGDADDACDGDEKEDDGDNGDGDDEGDDYVGNSRVDDGGDGHGDGDDAGICSARLVCSSPSTSFRAMPKARALSLMR